MSATPTPSAEVLLSDGGLAQIGLIWQVFATAGFAGGLVYWLVAGRRA